MTDVEPVGEFSVDYFMWRFHVDPDEVLGELRSGRLTAHASAKTLRKAKRNKGVNASEFFITYSGLIAWIQHPDTPPHLVHRVLTNLKARLQ
jgi:hypothetical protein